MTRFLPRIVGLTLASSLAACGGHEFEPPDRVERVREATAQYSPAMFDTVVWSADADRDQQGNQVYIDKCRRCHGPLGRGETDYDQGRGLKVPSLVEPAWTLASEDSLHRVIFVGHADGMPIFGDDGISPREIDAVTAYILNVLRPEVLGSVGRRPPVG